MLHVSQLGSGLTCNILLPFTRGVHTTARAGTTVVIPSSLYTAPAVPCRGGEGAPDSMHAQAHGSCHANSLRTCIVWPPAH